MVSFDMRKGLSAAALALAAGVASAQGDDGAREAQPSEMMPLADKAIINDVTRAGERLVAVGERGHILLSEDGVEWRQVQGPVRAMLTRVEFVDAEHGWAVGHDGSVLRSTDGGESWSLSHFDADWGKPFYDVLFDTSERGMVTGANGRMMRTTDGGETWEAVENTVFDTGFHLYEIERLPDGTLLIAGERGFLARSLDDGASWEMIEPPYIGSYFGVLPAGDHGAVFFGLQGKVYKAVDARELSTLDDPMAYDPFINESVTDPQALAGMGWKAFDNPVEESLFGGTLIGDGRMVLAGVDGTVVAGSVDSAGIEAIESPTGQPIADVIALDGELLMTGRTGFYRRPMP